MRVTSKNNSKIKLIRSLHQRKYREQTGLFVVEGLHGVLEALHHPERVEMLVVSYDLLKSARGYDAINRVAASVPVLELDTTLFSSIMTREKPHGIAAIVRQDWTPLENICHLRVDSSSGEDLWVALCDVQYPGNLGTILRTCDAVGAAGVILLGEATDPYHPTAVRAGLSAYFTQHLVRADYQQFTTWVMGSDYTLIGASADGAQYYRGSTYPLPLILMMGSEGHGINPAQRELCDGLVAIPMCGQNDSLNLAVATGVLLYEVIAQKQP
ncbi:RNA methyltransferase [Phototrophicus methaneseepsis]|uniref:RNA methyltransferase n=1 Tax=Phototrophicus methaneseepsis TaxID=2710758 RepID=A0A7S8IGD3_9CHLR|nr:RNA methyltransferase [Phototrophicus methaneseepsis]QPC83908.1 RNA methyltransferase [Phototrophicus methaneseepsis]